MKQYVAFVAVAASVASLTAQTPQFRTGTELVVIDVVATRADGNVARDLTAADFELLEDGKPKAIKTFQFINLEEGPARVIPPGVFGNTYEPGAIFALVIDEMKIDAQHTRPLREWARALIDRHVRPHDYVAVLRSGHDSGLFFTSDRAFLNAIIAQAAPRRARSATAGLASASEMAMTGITDNIGPDSVRDTEDSLYMLRGVVERLAQIPARRKAIFWFSQGVTIELDEPSATVGAGNNSARTVDALEKLLAAARRGNVAIYGVDPRGLVVDENMGAQSAGATNQQSSDIGGMRDISTVTGGRAIVNTNNLAGGIAAIVRENRAYYLLGYEPTDSTPDKRTRKIEVRSRRAGVNLLHRRAYVPDPIDARPAPQGSLDALLPEGELGIVLAPSVIVDPKGQLAVSVPFEFLDVRPAQGDVTFTLAALKLNGMPELALRGKVATTGGTGHDRARMQLAPGLYQLRLAAESAGGERKGVGFTTINVPEGNAREPQCGGLFLMHSDKRPNVTRVLNANHTVSGIAVVSARQPFAKVPLTVTLGLPGDSNPQVTKVQPPRQYKAGYWNVEFSARVPRGVVELALRADGKPLPGCATLVLAQ